MELPGMPTTKGKNDLSRRQVLAIAAAGAIVLVFVVFNVYLLCRTGSADLEWARAIYLLHGLESIAFVATGFLIGRDVHRRRAEQAEKAVQNAQESAVAAQVRATQAETRLEDLRKAILTYSDQLAYGRSVVGTVPMEMLVALVTELAPEEEAPES